MQMRLPSVFVLVAVAAMGQVTFDLQVPALCAPNSLNFPSGCGAVGDPEGVSAVEVVGGSLDSFIVVDGTPNTFAGFPTHGSQYARLAASGPFMPGVGAGNQLFIPIPVGATSVAFYWDWYNAEGSTSTYVDGMAIDVLDACGGTSLATLVYEVANAWSGAGNNYDDGSGGGCANWADETLPDGPNPFTGPLPLGAAYLRVSVWNGGDDVVDSHGVIDSVCFDCILPPPQPPQPPDCWLHFTSPLGPMSLQIDNTTCPFEAGNPYVFAVTLVPGQFPFGWFYGLDIGIFDLVAQVNAGFPFVGILDGAGASTLGPVAGLPSGFQFWAVTVHIPGFGPPTTSRPPQTYVIP